MRWVRDFTGATHGNAGGWAGHASVGAAPGGPDAKKLQRTRKKRGAAVPGARPPHRPPRLRPDGDSWRAQGGARRRRGVRRGAAPGMGGQRARAPPPRFKSPARGRRLTPRRGLGRSHLTRGVREWGDGRGFGGGEPRWECREKKKTRSLSGGGAVDRRRRRWPSPRRRRRAHRSRRMRRRKRSRRTRRRRRRSGDGRSCCCCRGCYYRGRRHRSSDRLAPHLTARFALRSTATAAYFKHARRFRPTTAPRRPRRRRRCFPDDHAAAALFFSNRRRHLRFAQSVLK